jgi:Flp pilus assembly protein TadD
MRFTVSSSETPPPRSSGRLCTTPEDPDAHNNLGLALTTKGQYQNAIAELRKAIRLKPNLAAGVHHAWKRAVSRQKVCRKSVAVTSLIQGMI